MANNGCLTGLTGVLAAACWIFTVSASASASNSYKILHNFWGDDGGNPEAGLVFDAAGNLYGTTGYGGPDDEGVVFQLTPGADGSWTETVLYSFTGGRDGGNPYAGLTLDAAGNLYGTTVVGGADGSACYGIGCGTVFRLVHGRDNKWTENVIHSFNNKDGANPLAGLVFDAAGNLYGTTRAGGNLSDCGGQGCGVAFELSPCGNGLWTEKVLHAFTGPDGASPLGTLTLDAKGNLYGTTNWGGIAGCDPPLGCGTVFELTPIADGKWKETVLRLFFGNPKNPYGALIFDSKGSLYGTTSGGGRYGNGTVFQLTPTIDGRWTRTTLHSFGNYEKEDGKSPFAGLVMDGAGSLYGTTRDGTKASGTVFQLSPRAGGRWTEKILHNFIGGGDGEYPFANVILDAGGNLYGTTYEGDGVGTVFEVTP